jgi:hypothetical protein
MCLHQKKKKKKICEGKKKKEREYLESKGSNLSFRTESSKLKINYF